MAWIVQSEIVYDSDNDDENEIRQLDAVLEEAEIEVCDTGLPMSPRWGNGSPAQCMASPRPAVSSYSASLLENSALTQTTAINSVETSGRSYSISTSQTSPSANLLHSNPQIQELHNIDSLLALNKIYEEKLRSLERILGVRLKECRAKLGEIQKSQLQPDKTEVFRYINCGRPYFRDQHNNPAPENEDTIMAKAQMYDFSLVTSVPGWTVRDKTHFTNVMTQISLEIRKDDYNSQISKLKSSTPNNKKKMLEKEINRLKKERNSLNAKIPFAQLALPLDQEYDWDLLSHKLNKRHTPHEYRCLWKLYFHPSINKSNWNNSEHNTLQRLAIEHHYQDWDEIARKLDTGRTGYQCFVYYRTNMTNSCIGKKWTHEEVTYLRRLIDYFREDIYIPWGKIAAAMENRTKIQIYNKYLRLIEQRKGRFLPEEDSVILNCVQRFGPNFKRITEFLSHRSMVQIRARYQVLNKMRISTVWTVEDDKKLVEIMSNQESNMTFSAATKYFPGKNRINIRSRYMTLIKWMKKHPNSDLEYAPRRGARRLNHGQASENLNQAIENLKNILSTEVSVKKDSKKITRDSDEVYIDDAIAAILVNQMFKGEQKKSAEVSTLCNEIVMTNKELDITNLMKCLIFMNSRLNENLYRNSQYRTEHPQLTQVNDVCLVRVKSYSRKNQIKMIKMRNFPDIWGNNALHSRTYVFPPHYATLTGCKALMSHITAYSMYYNSINLHVLVRRNAGLKYYLEQLMERCYILFLWPMLLSNESPNDYPGEKLSRMNSVFIRPPELPQAPEVTIKFSNFKKYRIQGDSSVIDLSEGESRNTQITVPEALALNSDIDEYIKTLKDTALQNTS